MKRVGVPERAPGRPRSEESRSAILDAAWALLQADGVERLTIEGVAALAGVGKATIYRWWPSKGALAVDAFLNGIAPAIRFPICDTAAESLRLQIKRLARAYQGATGRIVREMIGLGQFDPPMLQLFFDGYLAPRRAAAKAVLNRGIENGEFSPDLDLDAVVDAIYAPLFHRLLIGHAKNDEAFADFLSDVILAAIPCGRYEKVPSKASTGQL